MAEEWTDFGRTVLWPQAWALRHWHRFSVKAGAVSLSPSGPLPGAPAVRAERVGGDPPVWRLGWREPGLSQDEGDRSVRISPEQTAGVPVSVAAVRRAVLDSGRLTGEVRVVSEVLEGGSFRVGVGFR